MSMALNWFGKLHRFVKNPRPYLAKIWYQQIMRPVVWPIEVWWYRKYMLPRLIKKVSAKDRVTVLFLAMSVAYWKYDTVYRRMSKNPFFNVIIMPAMRTNQPINDQIAEHDELMVEFKRRGYNIVPGYDKITNRFLDARLMRPDIVFYTHPYSGPGRLRRQYDFWAMRGSLICYAPYFFPKECDEYLFNHPIQNVGWQLYYAYRQLLPLAEKFMDNKGINIKVTGYPFEEELLETSWEAADMAWKNDHSGRKRIIWAPHHSIDATDTVVRTSTFISCCEEMKELAVKYEDKVIFAFKPHPVLYSRLLVIWGRQKVDEYYRFWQSRENTQLQTGGYVALFKGSDALIHDCATFKCEYLYLNKPCLFLYRNDVLVNPNGVGRAAINAHYAAHSFRDVTEFVDHVVIGGLDPKRIDRQRFHDEYLKAPSGRPFSENVVSEILAGLGKS